MSKLTDQIAELERKANLVDLNLHKDQAEAWQEVFQHCMSLGMTANDGPSGLSSVKNFISRKVAEANTLNRIKDVIQYP